MKYATISLIGSIPYVVPSVVDGCIVGKDEVEGLEAQVWKGRCRSSHSLMKCSYDWERRDTGQVRIQSAFGSKVWKAEPPPCFDIVSDSIFRFGNMKNSIYFTRAIRMWHPGSTWSSVYLSFRSVPTPMETWPSAQGVRFKQIKKIIIVKIERKWLGGNNQGSSSLNEWPSPRTISWWRGRGYRLTNKVWRPNCILCTVRPPDLDICPVLYLALRLLSLSYPHSAQIKTKYLENRKQVEIRSTRPLLISGRDRPFFHPSTGSFIPADLWQFPRQETQSI